MLYINISGKSINLSAAFGSDANKYANAYHSQIENMNEYARTSVLNSDPLPLKDLYGNDFSGLKRIYQEPVEITPEWHNAMMETNPAYRAVCTSNWYAHIRICGRQAQKATENHEFLMDDLFRLYTIPAMGRCQKYNYNEDAHLWVFYIGKRISTEGERNSIWIQSPNSGRAHRYRLQGLSPTKGLILESDPRDRSAKRLYIDPYKDEFKEITGGKNYSAFKEALEIAEMSFGDGPESIKEFPEDSRAEWADSFLYEPPKRL